MIEQTKRVRLYYLVDIAQPFGDVVKTFGVCDIIYEHDTHRTSIITSRDRMESFLSRRIPVSVNKISNIETSNQ